jgi:hypothetical protein
VLFLHVLLLPLNVVRLAEIVRGTQATGDLIETEGVVRAQVLRASVTARGQPPVLPWSSARRTRRAQPSRSDSTRPSPLEMETRHAPHDGSHGADRQAGHDSLLAGLAVVGPTPDESMTSIIPLAVSDILCALSAQQARAQPAGAAPPSDAAPLREPRWGQGGPWAGIWITMTCQAALDRRDTDPEAPLSSTTIDDHGRAAPC